VWVVRIHDNLWQRSRLVAAVSHHDARTGQHATPQLSPRRLADMRPAMPPHRPPVATSPHQSGGLLAAALVGCTCHHCKSALRYSPKSQYLHRHHQFAMSVHTATAAAWECRHQKLGNGDVERSAAFLT